MVFDFDGLVPFWTGNNFDVTPDTSHGLICRMRILEYVQEHDNMKNYAFYFLFYVINMGNGIKGRGYVMYACMFMYIFVQ